MPGKSRAEGTVVEIEKNSLTMTSW